MPRAILSQSITKTHRYCGGAAVLQRSHREFHRKSDGGSSWLCLRYLDTPRTTPPKGDRSDTGRVARGLPPTDATARIITVSAADLKLNPVIQSLHPDGSAGGQEFGRPLGNAAIDAFDMPASHRSANKPQVIYYQQVETVEQGKRRAAARTWR